VRAWLRYPFAMAGPWAVLTYGALGLVNVANAAFVSRWAQWIVLLGTVVAQSVVVETARKRYARARGLEGRPYVPQTAAHVVLLVAAWAAPLVAQLWADFAPALIGVLLAATLSIYEWQLRREWLARGQPGDPRWAKDWQSDR
jgi:hypothetical protein